MIHSQRDISTLLSGDADSRIKAEEIVRKEHQREPGLFIAATTLLLSMTMSMSFRWPLIVAMF